MQLLRGCPGAMLQTQAMTASFYDGLTPIQSARGIFDDALYVSAPADWLLAVSDIKGSTRAVAEGRHADVNFTAAAMIASITCGSFLRAGPAITVWKRGARAIIQEPP